MADPCFEELLDARVSQDVPHFITFTYGWYVFYDFKLLILFLTFRVMNLMDENGRMNSTNFGTNYKFGCCDWNLQLRVRGSPFGMHEHPGRNRGSLNQAYILVEASRNTKMVDGKCFLQYSTYLDDEMRYESCMF